jgi:glycosyltransferase involved in cell wall biosynthesis
MNPKIPLTVVILTYNEEVNIKQALNNVCGWAGEVIILDSGSTDQTCAIAATYGVRTVFRKFDNYALQRTYAIKELPINTEWMLFLDADEYLTQELKTEIQQTLLQKTDIVGYYLKRRFYFMGKWIKYGGYYPTVLLRLFKPPFAFCEREINEHIEVNGKVGYLKYDFADRNHKDFSFWIDKHNKYATYEADALFQAKTPSDKKNIALFGTPPQRKAWLRENIWNRLAPPFVRPFLLFIYIYIFRLGFLNGRRGFIYHFMQVLVFWLWVDIKYLEKKGKQ